MYCLCSHSKCVGGKLDSGAPLCLTSDRGPTCLATTAHFVYQPSMNNPPTFSSFPARIAPTIEQKGERDSKAHRHAVADRNALPHKDAKRRRQRTLDNSERHSPPAPLAEPIRPSRDAAYKDVGFDRTRFSSAFSVDPPTYRRRARELTLGLANARRCGGPLTPLPD